MAVWASGGTSTTRPELFKPLALNTLGFAFRVASGEIIPQAMRGETLNLLKSRIGISLAKDGAALSEEELPLHRCMAQGRTRAHHERRQARRGVASRG